MVFFGTVTIMDHRRKNELHLHYQRKKTEAVICLAFLMRPKTRTAMVDGKNEHFPSVLFFSDFLPASDNSAINALKIGFS